MINAIFLTIMSTLVAGTKFCIDCKYYVANRFIFPDPYYGKCSLFPYIQTDDQYLVSGKLNEEKPNYYYCSTARRSKLMCDTSAKYFHKK